MNHTAKALDAYVANTQNDLLCFYKTLHQNPELSNQETGTAALLAGELRALGFEVHEQFGGNGLVAVCENGKGPTVLIRTDMDALPISEQTGLTYASCKTVTYNGQANIGVMHACGHDVHMSVFLGTAKALKQLANNWRGRLILVGQPAEELVQGAKAMLETGLYQRFGRPDYALALHVAPQLAAGHVQYLPTKAFAGVLDLRIKVKGENAHAGFPHEGVDAIVLASKLVLDLQTIVSRNIDPFEPAVVSVGCFNGGEKVNIMAKEVVLELTVRAYSTYTLNKVHQRIKQLCKALGEGAGLPPHRLPEVSEPYGVALPTINNPSLVARITDAFIAQLGPDAVSEGKPIMGGEDFGRYAGEASEVPIAIFWLGAATPQLLAEATERGDKMPGLHSPFFAPDVTLCIPTGIRAMAAAALKLLQS